MTGGFLYIRTSRFDPTYHSAAAVSSDVREWYEAMNAQNSRKSSVVFPHLLVKVLYQQIFIFTSKNQQKISI